MSAAFDATTLLLGKLSATELEQVGSRVAALRALSGPASSHPPEEAGRGADNSFPQLLYAALAEALQHETDVRQPTYFTFLRTNSGKLFVKAAASAETAHAGWFPKATRVETASLCRVYARCIVTRLERLQWPSVASAVASLPEQVSASFPGYARSGLLSMLLHRSEHG